MTAAPRTVSYVDPAIRAAAAPVLGRPWVAEEGLELLAARLERAPGPEAIRLRARARALADAALALFRAEVLPPGDPTSHLYVDAFGRLQLVARGPAAKVRLDEDIAAAVIRKRALPVEGPRVAALRQELRATLAIPLGTADRKPIVARRTVVWHEVDPNGVEVEFEPPPGTGFLGGRFEAMHVYGNGKVLLLGFTPVRYAESAYADAFPWESPLAAGALPEEPPPDLPPGAWAKVPPELRKRKEAS